MRVSTKIRQLPPGVCRADMSPAAQAVRTSIGETRRRRARKIGSTNSLVPDRLGAVRSGSPFRSVNTRSGPEPQNTWTAAKRPARIAL